jgi:hypothetical protein
MKKTKHTICLTTIKTHHTKTLARADIPATRTCKPTLVGGESGAPYTYNLLPSLILAKTWKSLGATKKTTKYSLSKTRCLQAPPQRSEDYDTVYEFGTAPKKKKSQNKTKLCTTFIQMAINQQQITLQNRTASTQWPLTTNNQLHCPETLYIQPTTHWAHVPLHNTLQLDAQALNTHNPLITSESKEPQ